MNFLKCPGSIRIRLGNSICYKKKKNKIYRFRYKLISKEYSVTTESIVTEYSFTPYFLLIPIVRSTLYDFNIIIFYSENNPILLINSNTPISL